MRIILFTGKGGVGKTTISAATALMAAQQGLKTLVFSTDPAHSLSDALDRDLSPEPLEVAPNLFAQEFDVYYSMKKHWGNIRELMLALFKMQGIENVVAEELSALPGMEEASAFLWLQEYYQKKEYDLIIIDSAPTGETLSLLSLPQVTQSWVMKAFPFQKMAMKGMGTMVRTWTGIPLDKGMDELEQLFDKIEQIQKVLTNPDICTIRIVLNPERMVLKEAKRAYTYLQLYGYYIDGVIVNRILPEELKLSVFSNYLNAQSQYLEEIQTVFAPLPIFYLEHQGQEVFGLDRLADTGRLLYQNTDPTQVLYRDQLFVLETTAGGYLLKIKIPFIDKSDFKLRKYGDELIIDLGSRRRSIFLPRFANYLNLKHYSFTAPWLKIELAH